MSRTQAASASPPNTDAWTRRPMWNMVAASDSQAASAVEAETVVVGVVVAAFVRRLGQDISPFRTRERAAAQPLFELFPQNLLEASQEPVGRLHGQLGGRRAGAAALARVIPRSRRAASNISQGGGALDEIGRL
ncbi:t39 [Tupaiid betaherpesvirus 1]|uniref:T39 n=1 Tax=Tupaiid herpesvirus 1 (strain 1) TaxID=10397 RepID=Q91TQ4_TUHV1|nr:t39 [Tupaiid betaherpesvirus 1]AAK57083.1 t39 [Tupaiid betaherpesvirus 1]